MYRAAVAGSIGDGGVQQPTRAFVPGRPDLPRDFARQVGEALVARTAIRSVFILVMKLVYFTLGRRGTKCSICARFDAPLNAMNQTLLFVTLDSMIHTIVTKFLVILFFAWLV